MTDREMIDLFFARDERALHEAGEKYGKYCLSVAMRILNVYEDAEECVNDTWLSVWRSIPPDRPDDLGAYLSRITRNLAIARLRRQNAEKRGGDVTVMIEELDECLSDGRSAEDEYASQQLKEAVKAFCSSLPQKDRSVFLSRYFYAHSEAEIAGAFGMSAGYVHTLLVRLRKKLKDFLAKEGLL